MLVDRRCLLFVLWGLFIDSTTNPPNKQTTSQRKLFHSKYRQNWSLFPTKMADWYWSPFCLGTITFHGRKQKKTHQPGVGWRQMNNWRRSHDKVINFSCLHFLFHPTKIWLETGIPPFVKQKETVYTKTRIRLQDNLKMSSQRLDKMRRLQNISSQDRLKIRRSLFDYLWFDGTEGREERMPSIAYMIRCLEWNGNFSASFQGKRRKLNNTHVLIQGHHSPLCKSASNVWISR